GQIGYMIESVLDEALMAQGIDFNPLVSLITYVVVDEKDPAFATTEFDIRNMLADGEQPVNQAMSDLGKIETNSIYKVIAPFIPAPLIDKASSLNISHWVAKDNDEMVIVYFYMK
ncbi:MAG: hypothetical protein U9O95_09540, partial [Candidatus Marinimicrobia bacterium]|nr:hypothetical protein [Candidatus Neomarinimicrobiota bacterium]